MSRQLIAQAERPSCADAKPRTAARAMERRVNFMAAAMARMLSRIQLRR